MNHQFVVIALVAAVAGTHPRLMHPNYIYGNHIGGSGDGVLDDEDYEGSGGYYEVSGRVTGGS